MTKLRADMKLQTVKASAYWASYLINNDASGLSDEELALADAWLAINGFEHAEFVDVSEPFFSWFYGFHTGANCQGGDLAEYQVLV